MKELKISTIKDLIQKDKEILKGIKCQSGQVETLTSIVNNIDTSLSYLISKKITKTEDNFFAFERVINRLSDKGIYKNVMNGDYAHIKGVLNYVNRCILPYYNQ